MLIRCPKCNTGFNLAAEKIPAKGAKVKCSACTHTFRVRLEDGSPVFFYKKGEAPDTGHTIIAAPDEQSLEETSEKTQFGIPQRSKSAEEGYNPFPLAGKITGEYPAANDDDTPPGMHLGDGPTTPVEDVELGAFDLDNERTQLGPQGMAEESLGDRTTLGAPAKSSPPPTPAAPPDEDGDKTKAFGSGGLDLFDGEELKPQAPTAIDFDPFGDAFEAPVGDVGLLMASTPMMDEPPAPSKGLALESSSEVGMSEDDFLLGGGGGSNFGDAASLVDLGFGEDVPGFDANSGVVDVVKRPQSKRGPSANDVVMSHGEVELEEIRTDERPQKRRRRPEPVEEPKTREKARPAPERRPLPVYAQNAQIGATSAVRRTFDVFFAALAVATAFVALVGARAGGFVDFERFGHSVEVAFADAEFIPREEWKQIVEIPPPDPPPDEPIRLENVRAFEKQIGDDYVLVVSGRVRNYSLEVFKGVEVRVQVKQGDKKLSDKVQTVGQSIDRKRFGKAKSMLDLKASVQKKLPDLGKEGTTYFAIVFDDVASDVVAAGTYDYSVVVAD